MMAGMRIQVRVNRCNGGAEISVKDTGLGIATEDLQAVFEEFRQVGTASRKIEGTGLGLAISRRFVELHGGTISVRSQLGAGSNSPSRFRKRRSERAPRCLYFLATKMKRFAQKKYSPSAERERMSEAQASASAAGTPLRRAASRVMSTRPAPYESGS